MSEITLKIEIAFVQRTRGIINISPNTHYLHYSKTHFQIFKMPVPRQGTNLQVSDDRGFNQRLMES